ncbi:hypothetical protein M5W83_13265 [Paenibacillus thiaminolyticus]|uniref:DUF5050 domain-containing protein n=1 Tax=Paenibacillus thiaminolyticus TaxID=49283 RepID=A0AAP9DWH5_PANTH|nr:hypothetical protein [Paenibacillus thiaminolyticus]MCY9538999.1 hypothetical protein [Paenibacillus thiaminolyticus]MCY9604215.1 hypothetical protein [Paenibacillus thiaminolyticus]MCY9608111.1 hypothetical protein [Paenibacillus thiaminolyticus]MCY9612949.1 hypothetical protein [Paenibacillus thiaminolyticus]MCY9621996.1 hypothetical protein [Paenibacillus thiaminolyticus]
MKKYISFTLLLCLILASGCSSKTFPDDNEYHLDWDYPFMYHKQGYGLKITRSDKGYYFLHQQLIYYMDKESTKPILLDNRPDNQCMDIPTTENCFAFVPFSSSNPPQFLQYYDTHLYVLESYLDRESKRSRFDNTWTLVRLDPDGKNRKVIKTFEAAPRSLAIHRGYLYYSTTDGNRESDLEVNVFKASLDNLKQDPELIYHASDQVNEITDIIPYGTQLYWLVFNEKGYETQRYDLQSGQVTTLWDRGDGGLSSLRNIANNRLYFSYFYGDPLDKRTHKKYSSDLEGNHIEEVKVDHPPIISYIYRDSLYTYIQPIGGYVHEYAPDVPVQLSIFKDNALIHQVDLSPFSKHIEMVPGDDRYMFAYNELSDKSSILYLDKREIESGQAKLKPLLETKLR